MVAIIVPKTINASQQVKWYSTVRARLGWLAANNLLLFGTGGFAFGRVDEAVNLFSFNFPMSAFHALGYRSDSVAPLGSPCLTRLILAHSDRMDAWRRRRIYVGAKLEH